MNAKVPILHVRGWNFFVQPSLTCQRSCQKKKYLITRQFDRVLVHSGIAKILHLRYILVWHSVRHKKCQPIFENSRAYLSKRISASLPVSRWPGRRADPVTVDSGSRPFGLSGRFSRRQKKSLHIFLRAGTKIRVECNARQILPISVARNRSAYSRPRSSLSHSVKKM